MRILANIQTAEFPLLSGHFGAGIFARNVQEAIQNPKALPQPYYMHNVLPHDRGLQSVWYSTKLDNSIQELDVFDRALIMRDSNENQHILSPSKGANYVNHNGDYWQKNTSEPFIKRGGPVTTAYIKQRTFVCYKRSGVFEYSGASHTLNPVVLNGVVAENFEGICYAAACMIGYTSDTIFWSSFLDPTDFVPSLATGAGSENVLSLRGAIVAVLPMVDGFVIYTTVNAVYAKFTQNLSNPWVYQEIPGAHGISEPEHVTFESNFKEHYCWSNAGLQQVKAYESQLMFPEISDFLRGKDIEDFVQKEFCNSDIGVKNYACHYTELFQQCRTDANGELFLKRVPSIKVKMGMVGSRYLAISYGYLELLYILVYDIALKRWGKLRIPHVDVFEYRNPAIRIYNSFDESFGILQKDGTILTVDFTRGVPSPDSVFLFGRIQYGRGKMTLLEKIEVTGVGLETLRMGVYPSYDGMTVQPRSPISPEAHTDAFWRGYAPRQGARSHILYFSGDFMISSLEMEMQSWGNR